MMPAVRRRLASQRTRVEFTRKAQAPVPVASQIYRSRALATLQISAAALEVQRRLTLATARLS